MQFKTYLFVVLTLALGRAEASVNDLLPVPSSVSLGQGSLALNEPCFGVELSGIKDSRVDAALQRFLRQLSDRMGGGDGWNRAGVIPCGAKLLIETKQAGPAVQALGEEEAYSLVVEGKEARLSADNALGVMHGLQTLLQLAEKNGANYVLPAVTILDDPRFKWRGLLIDASRHWMPLPTMKRNLDAMAAAKMNVLHWHLSDDQGFRVESKRYPKLHERASDGNFYTQEQVKEVLAYARKRGIRVVPEFDMPGHCTAIISAYPELGSGPGPYALERHFGVFDPTLDPTREGTYQFIDGLLGEMAGLFPDACLHIGGDENNGKEWSANPKIQAFNAKHKFKSNEDLQAYFSGRVAKILAKHGKQTVGWDEILQAKLPQDTVIQAWRGFDQLQAAARQGHDVILSHGYYLDLAQPASEHYLQDPLPEGKLGLTEAAHVLGGEACMWSELAGAQGIDSRIWPRALAVAERLWSPAGTRDVPDFYRRMEKMSGDLESLGLLHRSHPAALLKALGGPSEEKALGVLADALWPLRGYGRHDSKPYTQSMALNRLVDAVVPDGPGPRRTEGDLGLFFTYLADHQGWPQGCGVPPVPVDKDKDGVIAHLNVILAWRTNHQDLAALWKSGTMQEEEALSQDLSDLGQLAWEATGPISTAKNASAEWQAKAAALLERAAKPKAELELTVLPSVRKMVFAAAQIENLKTMGGPAWNKDLDAQVAKASQRHDDL